jgi:hypothetical protein
MFCTLKVRIFDHMRWCVGVSPSGSLVVCALDCLWEVEPVSGSRSLLTRDGETEEDLDLHDPCGLTLHAAAQCAYVSDRDGSRVRCVALPSRLFQPRIVVFDWE